MSRRVPAKPAAGIKVVPLLSVLICTMGAMVVLLFAFARHGQCLAALAQRAKPAEVDADSQELDWRISKLQEARGKTEAQLADRRLELSHIEDHERRLREDLERLRTSVLEMQRIGAAGSDLSRQTSGELGQLRNSIARAEEEVGEAQHDSKNKGVVYSVVPYQGPNQTRRRPIYVECLADSVILQPEGIVLKDSDFEGPLGPGNPLAAALRAVREHIASRQNGGVPEEPYPLLVVRPEGIGAYYAARAALVSWGSEFGYELVGANWKLQFPESDPQLRQLMRSVVTDARLRQQELIQAAPRQYAKADRPRYRASPHGGFVREGGSGSDDESTGGFGMAKRADDSAAAGDGSAGSRGGTGSAPGSAGFGQGGTGLAQARAGFEQTGNGYPAGGNGSGQIGGGNGTAGGNGLGQLAANSGGFGQNGNGSGQSGSGFGQPSNGFAPTGKNPGAGGDSFEPFGSSGSNGKGPTQSGSGYAQNGTGSGQGGSAGPNGIAGLNGGGAEPNGGGSPGGNAGSRGGGSASAGNMAQTGPYGTSQGGTGSGQSGLGSTQASSESGSSGAGSAQSDPSAQPGGMPSAVVTINANKPESMAKKRGRDWGVPDASNRRIGVTRPVFIVCAPDRLIILPEQGSGGGKEIPFGPRMQDSIDNFVDGVSQHVKTWGIAGKGLYWRPTLVVEVRPGAEQQYAELKTLLADSGLEVKLRQGSTPIATLPPNAIRR